MNQRIDLIYIDSGGGHRAAANSLAEVIGNQERPWELRMLNIQNLLDSIDFIRKITGVPFRTFTTSCCVTDGLWAQHK